MATGALASGLDSAFGEPADEFADFGHRSSLAGRGGGVLRIEALAGLMRPADRITGVKHIYGD